MENKSLKSYAREAKMRLKRGFWQNYKETVESKMENCSDDEVERSKVQEYYQTKVAETIRGVKQEDEAFYQKVKKLLDEYGEVSDALGRLTDKEYFNTLSYEQKQRYSLDLSAKYVKAKQRYYKEREFEKTV